MIRRGPLPFLAVKEGADKTYAVRRHSHETLSLGFVEEGSSVTRCHPLQFCLNAGDVILIPPETIHLCEPLDPGRFRFRMIYICPDWFKGSFGINAAGLSPEKTSLSPKDRQRAARFFSTLRHNEDRFLDETNAILFINHILSGGFHLNIRPEGMPDSPPPPEKMEQVKRFLDHHFDRDIQLDDLAKIAGASKYAVLRQFKRHWQITPHAYVINRRILAAKPLLKSGHSVADTAVTCGFFDQSHFIKTFKNYTGISPADFAG